MAGVIYGDASDYPIEPGIVGATGLPVDVAVAIYNVLLPPDANTGNPRGYGYLTVKMSKTGAATIAG